MRAAMVWANEHDPVLLMRLAVGLWPYFEARWHERHGHGVAVLESLLQQDIGAPEELRAWALTAVAAMGGQPGDARHAIRRGREAVGAFRRSGERRRLGRGAGRAGRGALHAGTPRRRGRRRGGGARARQPPGRRASRRATSRRRRRRRPSERGPWRAAELGRGELAAWRAVGSRRGEAFALRRLAVAQLHLGAGNEAARLCDRALDIWRDLDDPAGVAHVQITLADIARLSGDLAGAVDRYDAALVNLQAIGDRRCTTSTYRNLAMIAAQQGSPAASAGDRRARRRSDASRAPLTVYRSSTAPEPRPATVGSETPSAGEKETIMLKTQAAALQLGDDAPDFTADTTEGTDPLPRMARRQLGRAVLPPEGLHAGVHHRARRGRQHQARVRHAAT